MVNEHPPRFSIVIDDSEISDEDFRKFLVYIKNNKLFLDWHSPFPGFFIVESQSDLLEISDSISEFFDKRLRFYVSKLTPMQNAGFLAVQTWKWIKRFDEQKADDGGE